MSAGRRKLLGLARQQIGGPLDRREPIADGSVIVARDHYKLLYRLDGAERFLLWFTSEHDGVVTDAEFVPSFASEAALLAFASGSGIVVSEETPILHDL